MNTNLTEIAYVLDRSGSMAPMIEAAIATATRMGIAREMTARSEFSTKGVYRSSKVFSRKVRAMREASMHMEVNPDFHKPMDDLVEEEEGQ